MYPKQIPNQAPDLKNQVAKSKFAQRIGPHRQERCRDCTPPTLPKESHNTILPHSSSSSILLNSNPSVHFCPFLSFNSAKKASGSASIFSAASQRILTKVHHHPAPQGFIVCRDMSRFIPQLSQGLFAAESQEVVNLSWTMLQLALHRITATKALRRKLPGLLLEDLC